MKIPLIIGKIISKNEIVICPECEGEGVVFQFQEQKELPAYLTCQTCQGKRVLQKIENVMYTRIPDNRKPITGNRPPRPNNRKLKTDL
jgi:uncharacterized protein YbaR (Trm112 family)